MTPEQLERKRARNREWMRNDYVKNHAKYLQRQKVLRSENSYQEYMRQWRLDHQDKVIAQRQRWEAENKDRHEETTRIWRLKNSDRVRVVSSRWARKNYAEHSERLLKQKKQWRLKNPEKAKAIQQRSNKNCRQQKREYNRKWRGKNLEQSRAYHRKWKNRSNLENPQYRTLCRLRARVHKKLRTWKGNRTIDLCGATVEVIMKHLESQFRDGMTWENQSPIGWHIDHIIPCASFDLTDLEQQKKCFHYTNLQPLWWWQNLSKGKRIAA